jgi:hypothetical protein
MGVFMTNIDWFTWEPVESAHIIDDDRNLRHMNDSDLDTLVFAGQGSLKMHVPIGRAGSRDATITLHQPCTRRDVLTAIHEFYTKPARIEDVRLANKPEYQCLVASYCERTEKGIRDGETPTLLDLMGVANYGGCEMFDLMDFEGNPLPKPTMFGKTRRDWMMCTGLVRFEGLVSRDGRPGEVEVMMGT